MAETNSDSTSEQNLISDTTSDEDLSYEGVNITVTEPSGSTNLSFNQRFFKGDRRRFKKFIHSTTIHGVVHIFSGKSKIRRFLWLVLVLTAATGCLYSIIHNIIRLAEGHTGTTVSTLEPDSVSFPAVTLCNLNLIKQSYLKTVSPKLGKLIENAFYVYETDKDCKKALNGSDEFLPDLLWNGRHTAEETIFRCKFKGQNCTHHNFTATLMPNGGVCYTFNSGKGSLIQNISGTGTRFALTLVINVLQDEYSAAFNQDAGIKIAVHPQDEPPQPDELGIAISPGKNAFISVRKLNLIDRSSKRKCKDTRDTTSFDFSRDGYSVSACQIDCLMSNIARNCKCLGPGSPQGISSKFSFHSLQNCTVKDICCQVNQTYHASSTCDCPVACNMALYIAETTYSAFPANYAVKSLSEKLYYGDHINTSNDKNFLRENLLGINVYFKTLTVEEHITHNSYDAIALLSDIGGQLALFLGASVISVFEFLAWIFDEAKDRCFGISERKIMHKIKPGVAKKTNRHKLEVVQGCNGVVSGDQEM